MDPLPPSHVREIGATRPRLRSTLKYSFHEYQGKRCCIIEDPLSSKFHRIGLAEYRFLTFLNGKITFSEAFARASLSSGGEALSERQAVALLSWLVENRLADLGGNTPDDLREEFQGKLISAGLRNVFNILFIRIPLGRPDDILNKLYPFVRWACGRFFIFLWLIVILIGGVHIGLNWDRIIRGTEGILAPDNWLWLGLTWIVLKLWHETWHAIICKHYGGHIREAGVLLVLFTPLGYVDASSSWSFPSKWQRIHVAFAGMFGEFFLAAIAAIIWSQTSIGLINTLALNVMFTASMVTLLFNINPLMRFDGYFILCDILELPNLYTHSGQLLKKLAKKWILGVKNLPTTDWKIRETWIYLLYGISSLLWRVFIVCSLLIAASMLFRGGGLVLAAIGFAYWIIPLILSFSRYLWYGNEHETPKRFQAIFRCCLLGLSLVLFSLIPIGITIHAPALIQFSNEIILRAECPGFLTGIHVKEGMQVSENQLLVTLTNEEAEAKLEKVAVRYERQYLKVQLTHSRKKFAEFEAERDSLIALKKQFDEEEKYVASLDIRAPQEGKVIAPILPMMRDRFLKTGDEILRIANPHNGEILVPVSQNDIDYFRRHVGSPVSILVRGRNQVFKGVLRSLNARASSRIEHPALTTLGGGTLAVKNPTNSRAEQSKSQELVSPVFWAYIDIQQDPAQNIPFYSGERANIKFKSHEARTLGYLTYMRITQFYDWMFTRAMARAGA